MDHLSKLYGTVDSIQEEMNRLRSAHRGHYVRTGRLPSRVVARLDVLTRRLAQVSQEVLELEAYLNLNTPI